MSIRNLNASYITMITIIALIIYTLVYFYLKKNPNTIIMARYFFLIGTTGLNIIAAVFAIKLWKKIEKQQKKKTMGINQSISNNVLSDDSEPKSSQLLSCCIEEIDSKKKIQFADKPSIATSRRYEKSIQALCCAEGIGLIPKELASIIPIKIHATLQRFDCVLLDDDSLIISAWACAVEEKNKRFTSFNDPEEFLAALDEIDRNSPIFIDSNLKNNIKGQDLIPKVKAMDFKRIYLATGYDPEQFTSIPGLTAVIGKCPPKWLFTK